MSNYNQGASAQTVSREEFCRLDNRVTCILQQHWPANELSQWVGMLKGKQQYVARAILPRRHPRPASLALPAITPEVPNPYQTRANRRPTPKTTSPRDVSPRSQSWLAQENEAWWNFPLSFLECIVAPRQKRSQKRK